MSDDYTAKVYEVNGETVSLVIDSDGLVIADCQKDPEMARRITRLLNAAAPPPFGDPGYGG